MQVVRALPSREHLKVELSLAEKLKEAEVAVVGLEGLLEIVVTGGVVSGGGATVVMVQV